MAVVERKTGGDRALDIVNIALLVILTFIFAYPLWHCLMASFSDPGELMRAEGGCAVSAGGLFPAGL